MAECIEREDVLAKIDEIVTFNEACGTPVDIFDMEILVLREFCKIPRISAENAGRKDENG